MGGFLTLVAVALIGYFAWRGARKRYEEARSALAQRKARGSAPRPKPEAVTLEKDPETGVYRDTSDDDRAK